MYATSHQPMRTRRIRNDDGRLVRAQQPSRQRQLASALAEQTGKRP